MRKFTIIHTRDLAEIQKFGQAARQLWSPGDKLVFVRTGVPDSDEELVKFRKELDAEKILTYSHSFCIAGAGTIRELLASKNIAPGIWLGECPEFIDMTKEQREAIDTVTYRWVSVCRKCECVINERTSTMARKEAQALIERLTDKAEVSSAGNMFNCVESENTCRAC